MSRLLAALAALLPIAAAAADCDLAYAFRADWKAGAPRFAADMSFEAGGRTETAVRISQEWGGVTDFNAGVDNVRGAAEGIAVAAGNAPNRWIVKHGPQGRVHVLYDVVNRSPHVDDGKPLDHRDFFRNALGRDHFQVFGHGLLVWPESLPDADPVATCIDFTGLPQGWTFASNRTAGAVDGASHWRGRVAPQQLRASLFLGGDYRVLRREAEGQPIWIALRGTWKFTDESLADATARLVAGHRRFWQDRDFPHYLISLVPNGLPSGSYGGTALDDAFAMHAAGDMTVPGAAFEDILAHEHVHTWLPRRLGTMGMDDEATRYWFSEGFTNYLTHRLLLRDGLWTPEDYARKLDRVLRDYLTSTARGLPNARVAAAFWSDSLAAKVPYLRGEIFAIHVANRLAAQGRSLDEVLRGLQLPKGGLPRETDRRPEDLAVNRLREALRRWLPDSIDADLREYIVEGRPIPIDEGFLGPCFQGSWVDRPVYTLGFDAASLRSRKLAGVVPGSGAERAGLRDGMELAGWSVYFGDAAREITLQVKGEDGRVRDVKYLPVGSETVHVPEFTVRPGAAESPACRAWLA